MSLRPQFPIKVSFKENGEEWILNNEEEIASNLEWFNSDDISEHAVVTDKLGRSVRLKVEKLEILIFEITE